MAKLFKIIFLISIVVCSNNLMSQSSFLSEAERKSPLKKNNKSSVYELQNAFHEIYNQYKDSVVFISTEKTVNAGGYNPFMDDPVFREFFGMKDAPKTRKDRGLGTGFIISSDGYICTNCHVVQNVDSVTVTVSDKTYKAEIVGLDKVTDLALLKIQGKGNFKPVYLGNSEDVKVGDFVIAIGNPFGLDKTFTTGVVSGTGRRQLDEMGNSHIQTDAAINQGNSGGPLINLDGEVIGVNRAILSSAGGNIGIGFAIPINNAKETIAELKKYGKVKRGFLGVRMSPISEEMASKLGLNNTQGVLVVNIVKNGPAAKSGIREGDVIVKIDDKPVNDGTTITNIIGSKQIGSKVKITAFRNKTPINFQVTVQERP